MNGDLQRFVAAQEGVYPHALDELRAGRKQGHWMWFIFPQIAGLGRSANAVYFAIADLDEARAYLEHPVLGPRLVACAGAILTHSGRSAQEILGAIDAQKLRSSATLFREAGGDAVFEQVLGTFYEGDPCPVTLARLHGGG
ncbi:Uncharacterized protein, DUF1810 family [Poseidonocella pacifica]|uniref:Uncharacterized protein, DUF1810 family n=1 Tax=Poseidonocella pacifica TaxID=871651 RepID=A0A1I0VU35_9RHOB|nr:DUF1810 domain-containing protein [Poseidonocella pacifica]SFA79929.1 Uncharacterized protein, DUF1810 family [Poseidonocella pacifica]